MQFEFCDPENIELVKVCCLMTEQTNLPENVE